MNKRFIAFFIAGLFLFVQSANAVNEQTTSVLFVDKGVQDYQQLIAGVKDGTKVILIDSNKDGVQLIAEALSSYTNLDSIHILSHGNIGTIELGTTSLNYNSIGDYSTELSTWGNALVETGDILFYGCNVAKGEPGKRFIQRFVEITEADVAASANITGAKALGGDWKLEFFKGDVTAMFAVSLDLMFRYNGVLLTNGTADGTYDFAGTLGAADSGGLGFKTQNDKFKVSNIFAADSPKIFVNNSATSETVVLKAEGGATMKTFTVTNMKIGVFGGGSMTLTVFTFTFKNSAGGTIATHTLSSNQVVAGGGTVNLADMNFGTTFPGAGYSNVAQIDVAITNTSFGDLKNLEFQTITLSNISASSNNAPTASNGTSTVSENGSFTFALSEFNFDDIDGAALSHINITTLETTNKGALTNSGVDVVTNGTITAAELNANQLVYTPSINSTGNPWDSFQFKVHDGTDTSAVSYTMDLTVLVPTVITSGNWAGTSTWNTGTTTTFAMRPIVGSGTVVATISGTTTIANLTVNSGSQIALTNNADLTVTGTSTIKGTGAFSISSGSSVLLHGDVYNSSNQRRITVGGSKVELSGNVEIGQ